MAAGGKARSILRTEEALAGSARRDNDRGALRIAVLVALVGHGLLLGLVLPQMQGGEARAPAQPDVWVIRKHVPDPRESEPPPVHPPVVRRGIPLPDADLAEFEPIRKESGPVGLPPLNEEVEVPIGGHACPCPRSDPIRPHPGWITEPQRLHYVEPEYPRPARLAGIEGEVVLDVVIDEAGFVGEIEVLRSQPHGLTEAAVEAVRQWRYEPSTLHGRPVPVLVTVRVRFQLE
jgi:TonB family protein